MEVCSYPCSINKRNATSRISCMVSSGCLFLATVSQPPIYIPLVCLYYHTAGMSVKKFLCAAVIFYCLIPEKNLHTLLDPICIQPKMKNPFILHCTQTKQQRLSLPPCFLNIYNYFFCNLPCTSSYVT